MYEELDFHENDDLPLSQTLNLNTRPSIRHYRLWFEGNPAMYLSRTKRRAAREANLVLHLPRRPQKPFLDP